MQARDLKKIYNKCGEILHRGVIGSAVHGRRKIVEVDPVRGWLEQFAILLGEHMIAIPLQRKVFIASLTGGLNGAVAVAEATADGPFTVDMNAD